MEHIYADWLANHIEVNNEEMEILKIANSPLFSESANSTGLNGANSTNNPAGLNGANSTGLNGANPTNPSNPAVPYPNNNYTPLREVENFLESVRATFTYDHSTDHPGETARVRGARSKFPDHNSDSTTAVPSDN
jgi:hypothetical protein